LPAPKSTGFEHFNLRWLTSFLDSAGSITPADVQSTLCSLTATSIAASVKKYGGKNAEVIVCGGGAHNPELIRKLSSALGTPTSVSTTTSFGLDVDWVEACAFAWLAKRCLDGKPGNLPSVTGASRADIMGTIFP
jgi:anhydro-N-acetylmuramic acid kinase